MVCTYPLPAHQLILSCFQHNTNHLTGTRSPLETALSPRQARRQIRLSALRTAQGPAARRRGHQRLLHQQQEGQARHQARILRLAHREGQPQAAEAAPARQEAGHEPGLPGRRAPGSAGGRRDGRGTAADEGGEGAPQELEEQAGRPEEEGARGEGRGPEVRRQLGEAERGAGEGDGCCR